MTYPRENIARLEPYTPGRQPTGAGIVKLNTNENPFPPAPQVLEAIRAVSGEALRRYPPPAAGPLREKIAELHRLEPEGVLVTHGGDELIRMAVTAFCRPRGGGEGGREGGGLGLTDPTYSLYPVIAAIQDTPVTAVPRAEDGALPPGVAEAWNRAGCRLGMIVNPHAPSGHQAGIEALGALAGAFQGVLMVDEAYVDFAEADALALLRGAGARENVLVLRSFSKGYALAGLRLGYGLASPPLIEALDKVRDSYNTGALELAAGLAALEARDEAAESWRFVRAERRRLAEALSARGWHVFPSAANFVLARPDPSGRAAADWHAHLAAGGIHVRYFDAPRLADKLRITIGRREENDALLAAIDQAPPAPPETPSSC